MLNLHKIEENNHVYFYMGISAKLELEGLSFIV